MVALRLSSEGNAASHVKMPKWAMTGMLDQRYAATAVIRVKGAAAGRSDAAMFHSGTLKLEAHSCCLLLSHCL